MIRITLAILSLILASASIDGPTGYESNNWLGCFLFFTTITYYYVRALLFVLPKVIGQSYGIFTSNTLPPKLPPLERAIVPTLSPCE